MARGGQNQLRSFAPQFGELLAIAAIQTMFLIFLAVKQRLRRVAQFFGKSGCVSDCLGSDLLPLHQIAQGTEIQIQLFILKPEETL